MKDFETYCKIIVEIYWIKRRQLGVLSDSRIEMILDSLKQNLMNEVSSDPDAERRGAMRAVVETYIDEYNKCLRRI